jgi:hypothetical protein
MAVDELRQVMRGQRLLSENDVITTAWAAEYRVPLSLRSRAFQDLISWTWHSTVPSSSAFTEHYYPPTPDRWRIFVSTPTFQSRWFEPTLKGLSEIIDTDAGSSLWGDRSPVAQEFVSEALSFFAIALNDSVAPPALSPLNDGGLQAEWHRGGLDVELVFSPDASESGMYIREKATGVEREFPFDPALFSQMIGNRLAVTN